MNLFIILLLLVLVNPVEIIDLDKLKINKKEIKIVTIDKPKHNALLRIWNKNVKTIIYINDTNTTIVPTFLTIPASELSTWTTFKYVEIENDAKYTRLAHAIPFSPCITNMRQDETSWVRRSSRIILEAMADASFGVEFGFGSILDDNIVEYTLRYWNVFKVFKSRYVESSMGCSTNKKGYAARVFGFIPIIHNKMRVCKIEYNAEEGTISKDNEFKSLPPVRKLSNGVLKTICKVGTRDQLRCHENSGKFIDEYKNQFSFNVV